MRDTTGRHLLLELFDCDPDMLDDPEALERVLVEASDAVGSQVVARAFHRFAPQGATGVLVIEEYHISVHTWPEASYVAFDFLTCGALDPEPARRVLVERLGARSYAKLLVQRGRLGEPPTVLEDSRTPGDERPLHE